MRRELNTVDRCGCYDAHTGPLCLRAAGTDAIRDHAAGASLIDGGRWLARHPPVVSALATVIGAALWAAFLPRIGTDLSAALARADWARRYPDAAYLFSWYGGFHPAGYSLAAPYVQAVVGTRLAMAVAATLSAWLLTSLIARHCVGTARCMAVALWVAAALWTELSAGRAAFTLGLAAALGCVMVADISAPRGLRRLACAAALALLTCLFSPVAAVFLCLVAVVYAVASRWAEAVTICVAAALPLVVMVSFSDGGSQPAAPQTWLPAVVASVAVLLIIPQRWRLVRVGAGLYGIAVLVTWLVPSLVGSNIERLGELLAGPLVVGLGSSRHRWLLATGLAAAGVWQVAQPIADVSAGNGPRYAPQTAALVRELVTLHADTARVEAVPQYGHWESQQLASVVPLARGWERQLDIARNPLFYVAGGLTAAAYYRWLRFNAVRYVAICAGPPDWAAAAEADLVRAGQPWLVPVWSDGYWTLYRFTGAVPLASPPATVVRTSPAQVVVRMSRPGTAVVRVRWSPLLQAGGAVVSRRGPWAGVTVRQAGVYALSAPY